MTYYTVTTDRMQGVKKRGGGCAIFVKRGLAFKYLIGSNTPIEFQIGELYDTRKNKINTINMYNPCNTLDDISIREILNKTDKPCIICGDLNSHNPLWGSSNLDHNGKIVDDVMTGFDMVCIDSGEGTRINAYHGTLSCIDVTKLTVLLNGLTKKPIGTNFK